MPPAPPGLAPPAPMTPPAPLTPPAPPALALPPRPPLPPAPPPANAPTTYEQPNHGTNQRPFILPSPSSPESDSRDGPKLPTLQRRAPAFREHGERRRGATPTHNRRARST